MDRLTGASMARYKLRRLALNTITEEMDKLPEGNSKLSRIFNIVNQSDPDDLFAQFDEKKIIKIFSGKKSLPKSLSGTSASSPDALLFKKLRRFLFEEQHHVNPLGQNVHAIDLKWSDAELNVFHRTLNDFGTGSGSSYMSLRGYDKHTHLNKVHAGGTKVEPFAKLANADPELAAVEFYLNNTGNRHIADTYYGDQSTTAAQIGNARPGTPLYEALVKSKGDPAKFEVAIRGMNGATPTPTKSGSQPDLMGYQLWGNGSATESEKNKIRDTNGYNTNGNYGWEENGVQYSGTEQQSQAAYQRMMLKNGAISLGRAVIPGPEDVLLSALDSNVGQELGEGDIVGAVVETGKNFVSDLQQQFGTQEGLATTAATLGAAALAPKAIAAGGLALTAGSIVYGLRELETGFEAGQRGVSKDQVRQEKSDKFEAGLDKLQEVIPWKIYR